MKDTLSQIETWLNKAKELGYGTIEFTISVHDYEPRVVEMQAGNGKKDQPEKMTKRLVIDSKKLK